MAVAQFNVSARPEIFLCTSNQETLVEGNPKCVIWCFSRKLLIISVGVGVLLAFLTLVVVLILAVTEDGSSPETSAKTPPVNSSTPPVNSSTPPVNSSTPPVNSSIPPANSSTPPVNSSRYNAEGWQKVTSMLERSVNASLDPCKNFYFHVCYKYHDDVEAPIALRLENVKEEFLNSLQNFDVTAESPRALRQTKLVLNKCGDSSADPIKVKEFIENELGGWPLLNQRQNKGFNIWKTLAKVVLLMASDIFTLAVPPSHKDTIQSHMIYLDEGFSPYTISKYTVKRYMKWMGYRNNSELTTHVQKMEDFAHQLRNARNSFAFLSTSGRRLQKRMTNYKPLSVNSAERRWPAIGWDEFFEELASIGRFDLNYFGNKHFVAYSESYLTDLNTLFASTSTEVIQNYIIFTFLRTVVDYSSFTVNGPSCNALIEQRLPFAAARIYLQSKSSHLGVPKSHIQEMTGLIAKEFLSMLDQVSWLDPSERSFVKSKIANLKIDIGYPDGLMDDEIFDGWHPESQLNITILDDSFTSYIKVTNYFAWYRLQKLRKPVSTFPDSSWQSMFEMFHTNGLIYGSPNYKEYYNSLFLPVGYLQPPLLSDTYPMAWLFGSLGHVAAHEMAHALDPYCIKFDSKGNFVDKFNNYGFERMQSCLTQQYNSYCDDGTRRYLQCVEGDESLDENIADNAGLYAAFKAFKAYTTIHGEEKRLPGIWSKYSNDQLFFMSVAHTWCTTDHYSYSAVHAPPEYRVDGSVSNTPAFGQVFNCKKGDSMNPRDYCRVWN